MKDFSLFHKSIPKVGNCVFQVKRDSKSIKKASKWLDLFGQDSFHDVVSPCTSHPLKNALQIFSGGLNIRQLWQIDIWHVLTHCGERMFFLWSWRNLFLDCS